MGVMPGAHPLTMWFLEGVHRLRPVIKPSVPSWDLTLVLEALCGPPFKPVESIDIKFLSLNFCTRLHFLLWLRRSEWAIFMLCPFIPHVARSLRMVLMLYCIPMQLIYLKLSHLIILCSSNFWVSLLSSLLLRSRGGCAPYALCVQYAYTVYGPHPWCVFMWPIVFQIKPKM